MRQFGMGEPDGEYAEIQWEYGMYGPLRAGLQSKAVER